MTTQTLKLRFPEFKGEWDKKFGNKLFEPISNKTHNSDLPILAISQEFGAVPREMINYHISVSEKSIDGYKVVDKGDFIISLRSFQGGIEYSNYKGICSPAYIILRSKVEINDHFYKIYFKTNKYIQDLSSKLEGIRDGKMISYKYFSEIILPFPTLPEQTKIANFLTAIDEKIQALKQKKTLLEQYKKGIMQQIFSQELRFKNDDGSDFDDWEEKSLGKVSDVRDGTHDSPKYIEEGFPFITSKNLLENGKMDFNNITYISEEDYIKISKRSGVKIGDILFGMIGTIGNPVMVEKDGFAIKNVALIKEKENLSNNFLIHFLNSGLIKKQFYEENKGGTQKFLSLNVIRELKIQLPSLPEQTKIASFLTAIDEKIEKVSQQITATETYKKGLLQQMFI